MWKLGIVPFVGLLLCMLQWVSSNEDKKCEIGSPLPNVFCGRGPTREDCPDGYKCNIHPTDRYAVCCKIDPCKLPKEPGPCRGYFPSWYYNSVSGKCEKFIYGGCQGNANRFPTKEACERKCDPCKLPKEPGPCKGYFPSWYFNSVSGKCEKFIYGGCQGNANRFSSKKECEKKCDPCELRKDPGPCEALIPRWYYNSRTGKCQKFTYGGCEGNANNFMSKKDCEQQCGICTLPKDVGPCDADIPRWYYNSAAEKCQKFSYGGCEGNKNNFVSKAKCSRACEDCPSVDCSNRYCPYGFEMVKGCVNKRCKCVCPCSKIECDKDEVCELQKVVCVRAPCPPVPVCAEKKCEKGMPLPGIFCGRGPTRQDCPKGFECNIHPSDKYAVCCNKDPCYLKPDSGCGNSKMRRWYYDSNKGCVPFIYSGEGGNANNFRNKRACNKKCCKGGNCK